MRRSPANPNCELEIWTWGTFAVAAAVHVTGDKATAEALIRASLKELAR